MRAHVVMLAGLCLVSCSTVDNPYHSTAGLPYTGTTTVTKMLFVEPDELDATELEVGILACRDDGETEYLLVAPRITDEGRNLYQCFSLADAACVTKAEAEKLTAVMERALADWDSHHEDPAATYYEYLLTAESRMEKLSEHVVRKHPDLEFRYSHNSTGPLARLILGTTTVPRTVELEDKHDVQDVLDLLNKGLAALPRVP